MNDKKELIVSAIKDGTVIDHIPAKDLFKVIKIIGFEKMQNQMTFGTNLNSRSMGTKAIIKVADKFFADSEVNKIALFAPNANLNIIKNYEVVEKRQVNVPESINGIVKCMNPKCITNHEAIPTRFKGICKCINPKCITNAEPMPTRFDVIKGDSVSLRCCYCGKVTDSEHIILSYLKPDRISERFSGKQDDNLTEE
mgnify:CR=1 FL=1